MPKISIIGAGSLIFTYKLIGDILSFPELENSTLSLMDTDEERLQLITQVAGKMVEQEGWQARIESTLDRPEALEDANYVIVSIEVGGLDAYLVDIQIPDKYGINQNVGDTLGPGGVFRALRTIPVMLDICGDMERFCPDAYLFNYVNPMAMNCWAMKKVSKIRSVGLCHGVPTTAKQLAAYMQIPCDELSYWVAGINHMAWFLKLEWRGKDAYPLLKEKRNDPDLWKRVVGGYKDRGVEWNDTLRFEILEHFGYFSTESPYHWSEYCPYFRKTAKQIEQLGVSQRWWLEYKKSAESNLEKLREQIASGEKFEIKRSDEYASHIIRALETGKSCRINGNVENTGLITNLPPDCCVEVPCLVDKEGIHPCYVGDLPAQCAALNRTNINVQELGVKAALDGDINALYQAVAIDPLTSSLLTLGQIRKMVDDMLEAEAEYLPQF